MPSVAPVAPNSSVLAWARQESGFELDPVGKRLGVNPERLKEWETGDKVPTMRQLEHLAKFYHRPLGLFFRTKPPVIPPLATEYRRLNGVVPGHESPELRLAIRKMSNRRQLMIDLLEELGEETPSFDLKAHLNENPATVAERLRHALRVSQETQFKWANEWEAWASWRDAAEKLGILVFQFPKVPLEEARGISLLSWPFPVAAVNSKEMSPEARSFTLIHEVVQAHLCGRYQCLYGLAGPILSHRRVC
jgi:transcriptional regulator with XRE-family HTH domain